MPIPEPWKNMMPESPNQQSESSITLRPLSERDVPVLYEHQLDQEAIDMAVVYPRDRAAFDLHWAKIRSDPEVIARGIMVANTLAGHVSCFKMDGLDCVGYWIAKEHWGKGVATKGLMLLLDETDNRPLYARVARTNTASIRVLDKCGFRVQSYCMSEDDGQFPVCEEALMLLS